MVRTPERNYLRAWREYRGLTQAQLAEAVDTTGAVISLLESGDRGLSDKWLRRLAPVLRTRPGHLLETHPDVADNDVLEIFADIPVETRAQVLDIMKTFRKVETLKDAAEARDQASDQAEKPKRGRRPKGPQGV